MEEKSQVRMMSWPWAQVHRVRGLEQFVVGQPAGRDLGRKGRGCPCVHDVDFAGEAAGDAALVFRESHWNIGRRINGKLRLFGDEDCLVVELLAVVVDRVPDGDRHTEETLTGNQPVGVEALRPVVVTDAHEVRVEGQVLTGVQEVLLQFLTVGFW